MQYPAADQELKIENRASIEYCCMLVSLSLKFRLLYCLKTTYFIMEEVSQNIKKDGLLTLQVATLLLHTGL